MTRPSTPSDASTDVAGVITANASPNTIWFPFVYFMVPSAARSTASPTLISSSGAQWEAVYANLPVLFGINVRGDDQIVIGPRIGISRWYSSGSRAVSMPQIGSSLGYAWAVRRSLTIIPEVSWLYSPVPFQGRESGTALVTASIGFLFGH